MQDNDTRPTLTPSALFWYTYAKHQQTKDSSMFTFSEWLSDLFKAAGHKYIKRVPYMSGGKRRYRYIYNVTHMAGGKHVLDPEHMIVGAAFQVEAGAGKEVHAHIVSTSGDKVTYKLDDGPDKGKLVTESKSKLAERLNAEHGVHEALAGAREKQAKVVADLRARGASDKHVAREQARLDRLEAAAPAPKSEESKSEESKSKREMLKERREKPVTSLKFSAGDYGLPKGIDQLRAMLPQGIEAREEPSANRFHPTHTLVGTPKSFEALVKVVTASQGYEREKFVQYYKHRLEEALLGPVLYESEEPQTIVLGYTLGKQIINSAQNKFGYQKLKEMGIESRELILPKRTAITASGAMLKVLRDVVEENSSSLRLHLTKNSPMRPEDLFAKAVVAAVREYLKGEQSVGAPAPAPKSEEPKSEMDRAVRDVWSALNALEEGTVGEVLSRVYQASVSGAPYMGTLAQDIAGRQANRLMRKYRQGSVNSAVVEDYLREGEAIVREGEAAAREYIKTHPYR